MVYDWILMTSSTPPELINYDLSPGKGVGGGWWLTVVVVVVLPFFIEQCEIERMELLFRRFDFQSEKRRHLRHLHGGRQNHGKKRF